MARTGIAKAVCCSLMILACAAGASTAWADVIAVTNASFEQLPAGGLPNTYCGGLCDYSDFVAVPGWTFSGSSDYGEWLAGPSNGAYTYWNVAAPDGNNVLFSNGGTFTQTTSATVQAGVTYTLQVDLGLRKDVPDPGVIYLVIGSTLIQATGTSPTTGNWSNYTASYTGTSGTAGQSIGIELATSGVQGDFDNVRLTDTGSVPEPASFVLLLAVCLCLMPGIRRLKCRLSLR